jgi:hypothetical protein
MVEDCSDFNRLFEIRVSHISLCLIFFSQFFSPKPFRSYAPSLFTQALRNDVAPSATGTPFHNRLPTYVCSSVVPDFLGATYQSGKIGIPNGSKIDQMAVK